MQIVKFYSTDEAIRFKAWLVNHGVDQNDLTRKIESNPQAAQEFLGTELLRFREDRAMNAIKKKSL